MKPAAQDKREARERPIETAGKPCEVCGNVYDKAFQVVVAGKSRTFDSFECAIQALAPVCAHCQCRVIGHGVEAGSGIYCCAHCAKQEGIQEVRDRVA